ncbi:DUF4367 domain-containing protein [Candidatus Saccharibacteria bacterium]|nr:DUF4367 domain-containing protein [Candidatus Saccharibacteria bacterium]
MGQKPSLVEINGQLYDANSGRLFHHPRGPVIDGFVRKPRPINSKLGSAKERLQKPASVVHRRTQHSMTLMRSVVKKPKSGHNPDSKSKAPKARTATPTPNRISRAMNTIKNSRVDRFGSPIIQAKAAYAKAIPRSKPAMAGKAKPPASTALAARPAPSMITSVSHQRLERMLDKALIQADSHKKALQGRLAGKRRFSRHIRFLPRWLTIAIAILVVLSSGAYFAWRNIPYVSMQLASLRAQVKGSLPDYVPSGFKFSGPTQYESGVISMTFKAEEESRYFTLTQKAANWDSSSLAANTLSDDAQVQTSQVKGTTVYYSGDQAAWVNNGKYYVIKDHAQLNPDEIFKIADSIL